MGWLIQTYLNFDVEYEYGGLTAQHKNILLKNHLEKVFTRQIGTKHIKRFCRVSFSFGAVNYRY